MSPATRQAQEVGALAAAAEHRGTSVGTALLEALARKQHGWIRDVALLENAKYQFKTGHFDRAIQICRMLVEDEEEPTTWRGRCLRLLSAATMASGNLSDAQIAEVEGWLDEAERIFEGNRDPYRLGQVLREQGALALWKDEPEEAIELIAVGTKLESSFTKASTASESRAAQGSPMPISTANGS